MTKEKKRAKTKRAAGSPERSKADADASPEDQFPQRLATLREAKGLKHDSLSELTKLRDPQKRGIARTTLRGYEFGIYKPGIRELRILSQALGVSPNELIFGERSLRRFNTAQDAEVLPPEALFMGFPRAHVVELFCFVVTMFKADISTRQTIFDLTAKLAEAKMGPVEYQRMVGLTREIADTTIDTVLDETADGVPRPEQLTKVVEEFLPLILDKFGIKPVAQSTKPAGPSQQQPEQAAPPIPPKPEAK